MSKKEIIIKGKKLDFDRAAFPEIERIEKTYSADELAGMSLQEFCSPE
ncbi:hypothetical protein [Lewinella sp. JB7]|nr:hypothetical protein [Lewinella sp. JB7]MCP9237897.1 hypothetical protein [Lewinella sp. JB7]